MTDMTKVAFVDTETLGLDPDRNPVWEIAVIVDDVEHCWQVQLPEFVLVEEGETPPERPYVSTWVLENTGFGERYDAGTALTPTDAIERFCGLVAGRHLVGAVPSFDEERLRAMCRRYLFPGATRFPWHYHLIDVEALAVGFLAGVAAEGGSGTAMPLPWHSDELSSALGVRPPQGDERHTALADARWAKAIFEAILNPKTSIAAQTELTGP